MPHYQEHAGHNHQHRDGCGHIAVRHEGHVDYLHDGHLHHQETGKVTEHTLSVSDGNPQRCTPDHQCNGHDAEHEHGPGCGHETVPHGDHTDYLVGDHLHHPHEGHCDEHGRIPRA